MRKIELQTWFLYAVLFFSGFAGLGYEMVWTRMLAIGLGHEIVSVLAVIAAFFCGMSLGAWCLDGVVSQSIRPGRWYAFLELGIGLWSLALLFLIPSANRMAAFLIGMDPGFLRHWTIAFLLPFFLLLPASFSMGATLPAMERLFSRLRRDGCSVGGLYSANTFGAVAGTLMSTFLLAPAIGFKTTAACLALVNFLCALGVMLGPARNENRRSIVPEGNVPVFSSKRITTTLFLTGFLGIGYEVLVVRTVSQVLENTVYSFACLLSVYLIGTATGAAVYQKISPEKEFKVFLTFLLQSLAFCCLIGIAVLPKAESVFLFMRNLTGGGTAGAITGELCLAAAVFFLPTLMMGATFSHLAQASRKLSGGVGRALAVNTLGATFSPLFFGVFLVPLLGAKLGLTAASAGYLFLVPSCRVRHLVPTVILACLAVFMNVQQISFNFISLPSGSRIAEHIEGVMASVSVIEDQRNHYHLKVNNKFLMGGTSSAISDRRQGHIPLLLHPNPKKALFLGLGTGATFAASADYPDLKAHGVELVPEVVEVLPFFEKATGPLGDQAHLKIHVADARRFVNTSQDHFDVIVADLFHPARDGAGFLYTVEHFHAIQSLLNPGGLFCQWLPLYQMDLNVLRDIVRTFLHVFPDGKAFLATLSLPTPIIGLISNEKDQASYPVDYLEKRVTVPILSKKLAAIRLNSTYNLFGTFISNAGELADFAGPGSLNTDDHPVVLFRAPGFAYANDEPAHVRLFTLLNHFHPDPSQILQLQPGQDRSGKAVLQRLTAFWEARNLFLKAGVGIRQTNDVEKMLEQVKAPLLSVVRKSRDFDAAYTPLLVMARHLYQTNPRAAELLLIDLEKANPFRQGAKRLRKNLF